MLRRKLLARLGVLVTGFIAGAVVAIVLLQGVLRGLDENASQITIVTDRVEQLGSAAAALEAGLRLPPGADRTAAITHAQQEARSAHAALGELPVVGEGEPAAEPYGRTGFLIEAMAAHRSFSADTSAAQSRFTEELRAEISRLRMAAQDAMRQRQLALSRDLRTLIIGLTLAALVWLNVTAVVLLRTGAMILEPVDALVEGSELLARERFDHRVEVSGGGEFGQLAHAYNALAEQLQANEARKTETLRQLGVTLNHELNNVINVIELQLSFLDRRAGGDDALADRLRQIRENLARMGTTVASLKDIRRVVVTDYIAGMKMVDLPRSTEADEPASTPDSTRSESGAETP